VWVWYVCVHSHWREQNTFSYMHNMLHMCMYMHMYIFMYDFSSPPHSFLTPVPVTKRRRVTPEYVRSVCDDAISFVAAHGRAAPAGSLGYGTREAARYRRRRYRAFTSPADAPAPPRFPAVPRLLLLRSAS
jgi:hypothetical protein